MTNFVLDERLESESFAVTTLGLCQLRLRDDMRWPWLILIPQRPSIIEQHDLAPLDPTALSFATNQVSKALKDLTACTKINIGTRGNIVRPLPEHVVARHEGG